MRWTQQGIGKGGCQIASPVVDACVCGVCTHTDAHVCTSLMLSFVPLDSSSFALLPPSHSRAHTSLSSLLLAVRTLYPPLFGNRSNRREAESEYSRVFFLHFFSHVVGSAVDSARRSPKKRGDEGERIRVWREQRDKETTAEGKTTKREKDVEGQNGLAREALRTLRVPKRAALSYSKGKEGAIRSREVRMVGVGVGDSEARKDHAVRRLPCGSWRWGCVGAGCVSRNPDARMHQSFQ